MKHRIVTLIAFAGLVLAVVTGCKKSNPVAPTPPGSNPPAMPLALAATAGNATVSLIWNAVSEATSYNVYWDTAGDVDANDVSINSSQNSLQHGALTNGTTYSYRVSAVNGAGESLLSPQVSAMPSGAIEFRLIACGDNQSFFVKANGSLYSWGDNTFGQLGVGSFAHQLHPTLVQGISDVVAVDAARTHVVALTASGRAYAWGANGLGQLGNGTRQIYWSPSPVNGPMNFVAVAAGRLHSLGVTEVGEVWIWGANSDGQLGLGHQNQQLVPGLLGGLFTAKGFVAAGDYSSYYKATNDATSTIALYSWGLNTLGQLGRGDTTTPMQPSTVSAAARVTSAAARLNHVVALRENGSVIGWGRGREGQLGDAASIDHNGPITAHLQATAIAVGAGNFHSIALQTDGHVAAWGANGFGQLGDGTNVSRTSPIIVPNLSEVVMIAAGANHNLVLRTDGSLWSWGHNLKGQLGNGLTAQSNIPVRVVGY